MLYEVVRQYPGPDGEMRRVGDIIDGANVRPRNLTGLIEGRRLRPYVGTEQPETAGAVGVPDKPKQDKPKRVMAQPLNGAETEGS